MGYGLMMMKSKNYDKVYFVVYRTGSFSIRGIMQRTYSREHITIKEFSSPYRNVSSISTCGDGKTEFCQYQL